MKMREQTIASSIEFKGIGLHTGELATVRILPAPAGKGIIFRRVDLDNFELRADVASVARVAYATTLMSRGVWISTVEHLLSALYGVGVDNAYIELDNFEVPILDGSALPFTEGLARAGVVQQSRRRKYIRITKEFVLSDGGKTLGIYPSDSFSVKCDIDFPHPLIGKQSLDVELSGTSYADFIAPARTFGFYHEVEKLQANGLIRGGSLENAIVLTQTGILNDTSLRFQDEFVRHKTLDLLGDFALIGQPVLGRLVANRAGHALHTRFVAELLESKSHWIRHTASEMSVSAAR
ncbi:MAG: UDP-3-O-[3-hydroxymyristoyl] N-acetylglucosamine deacetylase [Acidobacteria bacterium]|nr:MAG: UDP-3-O-[3-hydroxymyristoyl] N-acetylglucosamine deacetylase [Acidobacteriota bacterium]